MFALGWTARLVGAVVRFWWVQTRWVATLVGLAALVMLADRHGLSRVLVAMALIPGLVCGAWSAAWTASFERSVAGPVRRRRWRRLVRSCWTDLARECGLSVLRERRGRRLLGRQDGARVWVGPRLVSVTTYGAVLTIVARSRTGQTVDDLESAVPALGSALGARSWRSRALSPSTLELTLVMGDELTTTRAAEAATSVRLESLAVGRRQDGSAWVLPVMGRHTLVVGCSGSGKGSVFWGVCGGFAPAVSAGLICLWGIDLKRGVEVGMGRHLFAHVATTPGEAVEVLARLLAVIDERGRSMAGRSRLHQPVTGEPLHVLAVDELAVLTAYADPDTRREASRLLSEVLTQGRALGVVVLACVQDPRKEVIGLRGLFTQTVALRLRSAEETRMVLGEGMVAVAPAHRISPAAPGTAWVVEEDGAADRVRADFWSDDLVRSVAATHPAPMLAASEPSAADSVEPSTSSPPAPLASVDVDGSPRARRPRSRRGPRSPRAARAGAGRGGAS